MSECCMPMQDMRRPQELVPGNIEARVRERQESRRDGGGNLFGRQGVLREIAQMQMPMPAPESKASGAPNYGERRAADRREAKEARVQAILEERTEHERLQSENLNLRKIRLTSGSVSMPVLPTAGAALLSLGPADRSLPLAPEEMERQKLRVACKMETLAFLNGYHNAMGKMTMEQKAALLAQLHQSKAKAAAPRPSPDTATASRAESEIGESPVAAVAFSVQRQSTPTQPESESQWGWPQAADAHEEYEAEEDDDEQEQECNSEIAEPSVYERLQHANDIANQAFVAPDFDDPDFDAPDF